MDTVLEWNVPRILVGKGSNPRLGLTKYGDLYETVHLSLNVRVEGEIRKGLLTNKGINK